MSGYLKNKHNCLTPIDNGIILKIDTSGTHVPQKIVPISGSEYALLNSVNIDWNEAQLSYLKQIDKEKLSEYVQENFSKYNNDSDYTGEPKIPTWINKTDFFEDLNNDNNEYEPYISKSTDVLDIINYLLSRCIYLDKKYDNLQKKIDEQTVILAFNEEELERKYGLKFDEYGHITNPVLLEIRPNETNPLFTDLYVGEHRVFDFMLIVKNMVIHDTLETDMNRWAKLIPSKIIAILDGCVEMRYVTETSLNGLYWKLLVGVFGWKPDEFDPVIDYEEYPYIEYKTKTNDPIKLVNLSGTSALNILGHYKTENNKGYRIVFDKDITEFPEDFLCSLSSENEYGSLATITSISFKNFHNIKTINDNFLSCDIEKNAFKLLEHVDFSGLSNAVNIGNNFMGFSSMQSIDFSAFDKLESIGNNFLHDCASLKSINNLNLNKATRITDHFIENCTELKSIKLVGQNVRIIDTCFAENCSALTEIDLRSFTSLETINSNFLRGCSSLKSILMPSASNLNDVKSSYINNDNITIYVSADYIDFYKNLFTNWKNIKDINSYVKPIAYSSVMPVVLNTESEEEELIPLDNDVKGFKIMLNSESDTIDTRALNAYVVKCNNIIDYMFINDQRFIYIPANVIDEEYYIISSSVLDDNGISYDYETYTEEDIEIIRPYLIGRKRGNAELTFANNQQLNIRIFPRYFGESTESPLYCGSNDLNTPEDFESEGKIFIKRDEDRANNYEIIYEVDDENITPVEYVEKITNETKKGYEFDNKLHKGFGKKITLVLDKDPDRADDVGQDFGMGVLRICTSPTYYVARNDLSFVFNVKSSSTTRLVENG